MNFYRYRNNIVTVNLFGHDNPRVKIRFFDSPNPVSGCSYSYTPATWICLIFFIKIRTLWILKGLTQKKAFNVERITGPAPLTGSAPEVDRVYPVPRPELRPSFVEIHSVISVQFCWQTNQTTKRSWKTDPISAAFTKLPRAFTQSWQRHINQEHTGRPAAASAQQKKKGHSSWYS